MVGLGIAPSLSDMLHFGSIVSEKIDSVGENKCNCDYWSRECGSTACYATREEKHVL